MIAMFLKSFLTKIVHSAQNNFYNSSLYHTFWLYVNSWGKEKPIERKKQVVKNETERSEVEFSLPAFARWVIEICTEYENGSV